MQLETGKDCYTCTYCRNIVFPVANDEGVRVLGPADAAICPVCAVGLSDASLANVRLQYCTRCRGMLIPMGAFAALVEQLRGMQTSGAIEQPSDPADLHRQFDCPHCLKHMVTHFYAGSGAVIIASCDDCELDWLDHGKLMRIVRAADYSYDNAPDMV
jgi:Zn-finger nucleic acid-binding protein